MSATVMTSASAGESGWSPLGQIPGTWYTLGAHDQTKLCGARALFTNGLIVAMMHAPNDGGWFFILGHHTWKFQEGRSYEGTVSIDGQLFTGEPIAVNEQAIGLFISKEFMHAFTIGSSLTVHHTSGTALATVSLAGTTNMVEAVARCTQVVQAQMQEQPFGTPKTYSMPEMPFAPKVDGNAVRRFAGAERGV